MPESQLWIHLAPDMLLEWEQSHLEGRDVENLKELCSEIAKHNNEEMAERAEGMLKSAPLREDFTFVEPSDYEGIQKEKPASAGKYSGIPKGAELEDKLTGAWIGRIAGCLLGKPVEGYKSDALWRLLRETDNFPLHKYIGDFNDKLVKGGAPVDDDTNYTVLALKLLEVYGRDFTPDDVLEAWLKWIPYLQTCTAERVAYRNAANGLAHTATVKNPYREWIGAQIRGDFFGYINIGNPRAAAEMAWRDASVSHIKNGIYGEMFISALIAAAAVCGDIRDAVEKALDEIPRNCRLRRDINQVLSWHKDGCSADAAIEKIHRTYDEHTPTGWCYTNPNAMVVVMALLYGEKDFGKTICLAVQAAFDTDCNGATAGSVMGIMLGAGKIDSYWPEAFHYRLKTSVEGYETVSVDELVKKTVSLTI
ncbi:MAG: ADP-ribosylglycohydrolase family protein [Oscillospiraceae bacterium]|nr:ADP-ribosylglycohydrolase family protein [Oscillospiraceae bacterium]